MNKFLAYTWLAALSLTGMAASAENSHFLDVWAGGGYDALRRCPVLWRGGTEMPDLTAAYVRRHSPMSIGRCGPQRVLW